MDISLAAGGEYVGANSPHVDRAVLKLENSPLLRLPQRPYSDDKYFQFPPPAAAR
jgi:hypothetical protein